MILKFGNKTINLVFGVRSLWTEYNIFCRLPQFSAMQHLSLQINLLPTVIIKRLCISIQSILLLQFVGPFSSLTKHWIILYNGLGNQNKIHCPPIAGTMLVMVLTHTLRTFFSYRKCIKFNFRSFPIPFLVSLSNTDGQWLMLY